MRIAAIGDDSEYYSNNLIHHFHDHDAQITEFKKNDELIKSLSQRTDLVFIHVHKQYLMGDAASLIEVIKRLENRPWTFIWISSASEDSVPLADFIAVGAISNDYLGVIARMIESRKPERHNLLNGITYSLGRMNTIVKQILESFGINVYAFKDKESFMKAVENKRPDAVLVREINNIDEEYKSLLRECKRAGIRIIGLDSSHTEKIRYFEYETAEQVGDKYLDYCDHFRDEFNIIMDDLYELFSAIKRNEKSNSLMYSKAAQTGIFDKRSKMTADLDKELAFIRKTLRKNKCKKILDVGCGNGRLSIPLAHPEQSLIFMPKSFEIVGGDVNKDLLEQARSRSPDRENPRFIYCDAKNIPFKEGYFDAVIMMWHVICEFNDSERDQVINEVHRVLKSQGVFIADMPLEYEPEGGYYNNKIQGAEMYHGRVPPLKKLIIDLEQRRGYFKRFDIIKQSSVKWGIRKEVIVAQKAGWH